MPLSPDRFEASYLIETPLDPGKVAEVMAGEQSCGTFTRVEGETDALRERARAIVIAIEELPAADAPSLPNAWLARKKHRRRLPARARVTISFPVANVGANLATLAAIVAGNLYDLGEVTGPAAGHDPAAGRVPQPLCAAEAGHRRNAQARPALRRARSSARSSSRMWA